MKRNVARMMIVVLAMVLMLVSFASCAQQGQQGPAGPQGVQGIQGETGNGVESIVKTSTEGLVDTYTVKFTDGTTTTFTVTNGADGEQGIQGIQGEKGEDGHTPVITIQNGKWYIDGVDSGKSAEGIKGDTGNGISSIAKTNTEGLVDTYTITFTNGETTTFTVTNGAAGAQGQQGIQGIQGEKGEDGHTPVITIQNGKWYIDGVDSGKSAEGIKGDTGNGISSIAKTNTEGLVDTYTITFTNGDTTTFTVTNGTPGTQGEQGIQGIPGKDGKTPVITIENGRWYIDGVDTGKSAEGVKGDTGNGIEKIEKTKTEGLVDTYTITYTNGDTTTFTVTNGAAGAQGQQGIQGIQGEKGADGHTPVITIQNGKWYIDGVDSGKSAEGIKGDTGNGISSIAKTKTEGLVDTYTITFTNGDTTIFTVTNGADGAQGEQGIQGVPGKDGHTPVITIENGRWYIDGVDTGKSAVGVDGNGIEKIEKTKTEGLVDTYTITYTNGSTTTFTVTNGAAGSQGIQGIQGEKGQDGHTPVITIQNGKWYIDGVDSGVLAEGVKGETGNGISSIAKTKTEGLVDTYTITFTNGDTTTFTVTNGAEGAQGEQGIQGIQGEKGEDGHTPVITIQNGKWYIDGVDSGKSAEGVKGDTGNGISSITKTSTVGLVDIYTITFTNGDTTTFTVTNGADGAQGQQGIQGIQGEKGEDGHTPVITIQNGRWYIDGVDSGKSAEGVKGDTGNGISSIVKTKTEGLVDTYTITFTNGDTTTFTVTNGADGAQGAQGIQGIQGEKGEDGHTPVITIQNDKWYIDGVDTGKSAVGATGNGIEKIEKTKTEGLVDTYTITFTNGETTTFTVTNGATGAQGQQGVQGIQGEKGEDGHTPVITIQNGKWYIDGVDSGKSAEGVKGDTGNGISSIAKTNTEGLVDTYTITFTNGETTTFVVTNGATGAQGIQGIQGEKGEDGHTPIITIQNGKWYIDGVDSGKSAEGVKGDTGNGISSITKTNTVGLIDIYTITFTNGDTSTFTVTNGADGEQGVQGIQGEKGEDGHSPVITIQNGRWYIDGVDSGKSAEGVKGDTGNGISSIVKTKTEGLVDTYTITFTNGDTTTFTVTNGADGAQGAQGIQGIQGEKGEDGHTPVITIQNGKWYIDGVDSGKSAEGVKGDTGNGISNIAKTKTEGLVDTYTITYTNGTTTTFTVTNGANGQQGIQGEKGDDGHTPVITIQNGRWYIDGVDTGKSAEGVKGDDGLSAFEIYQKYHPEYTGTEEEWIESLKGEQGVSITNAYVDENLHLWIVLSNGTKIDAGYVGVTVNPSPLTYTVTFVDYDGTVLKTETVEHGKNATPPTDPVRVNYQFVRWDVDYSNVTADITVTAEYASLLPTISIENIQVSKETSEVTFDVCVKNNPGIMNMVLSMTIDDVVFNFKTAVKGDALPSSSFTKPGTQVSSSPYRFLLDAMEITNEDKEDGVIFTVTLSIDDLTAIGEYEIELTYIDGDIVDENFEPIDMAIENGTIVIE